jgi:hypothetical protein
VTIHGTDNLLVENNVTYNTVGHCFFMEDGIETGNQLVATWGSRPSVIRPCRVSDKPRDTRAQNGIRMASAPSMSCFLRTTRWRRSGSPTRTTLHRQRGRGFRRDRLLVLIAGAPEWCVRRHGDQPEYLATSHAAGEFRGNVAHSNFDGLMFDRNIAADNTFGVTGSSHIARENPADPNSRSMESVIEDFTAYKNRNGGIWGRGEMKVFRNLKLADNAIGFTHASGSIGRDPFTSKVVDSLFVGETDNIGNPRTPEEIAYGRSLPKAEVADFPIRGYEYYDFVMTWRIPPS